MRSRPRCSRIRKPLADALFPVIGPAIRKAVAHTFDAMIDSVNQTIEQSVSWQAVQWRWTAWRTGKPFAEIVHRNTARISRRAGLPDSPRVRAAAAARRHRPAQRPGCRPDLGHADGDHRLRPRFVSSRARRHAGVDAHRRAGRDDRARARTPFWRPSCADRSRRRCGPRSKPRSKASIASSDRRCRAFSGDASPFERGAAASRSLPGQSAPAQRATASYRGWAIAAAARRGRSRQFGSTSTCP